MTNKINLLCPGKVLYFILLTKALCSTCPKICNKIISKLIMLFPKKNKIKYTLFFKEKRGNYIHTL